ncbi:MAG TPA: DUF2169 domain-containing protein, partial [Polyangia bacterium]|nr:DUF2169 domain-containing protein [Polyangia bacterium]
YTYFPRSTLLGAAPLFYDPQRSPPSSFLEVKQRELSELAVGAERNVRERLGLAVAQSAALGLRAASVKPGDAVAIHGLHPGEPRWNFQIPLETPRMGLRFANEKALELPAPVIRTVYIEPDDERLTLVWVAELQLPDPPGPKRMATLKHIVMWT